MKLQRRLDRIEEQLAWSGGAAFAALPAEVQLTVQWIRLLQQDLEVDEAEALRHAARKLEVDEDEFAAAMREYLEVAGS